MEKYIKFIFRLQKHFLSADMSICQLKYWICTKIRYWSFITHSFFPVDVTIIRFRSMSDFHSVFSVCIKLLFSKHFHGISVRLWHKYVYNWLVFCWCYCLICIVINIEMNIFVDFLCRHFPSNKNICFNVLTLCIEFVLWKKCMRSIVSHKGRRGWNDNNAEKSFLALLLQYPGGHMT